MMLCKTIRKHARSVGWNIGLLFLFMGCLLSRGSTQNIHSAQVRAQLAVHTRLMLGATTLAKAARALSEQIGVNIEVADYLQEHNLTVCLDDLSGLDVLNTLADFYGWRWFEQENKTIVITHLRPKNIQQIRDIPFALQAALPNDVRWFLGIDLTPKDPFFDRVLDKPPTPALSTEIQSGFKSGNMFQMNDYTQSWKEKLFELFCFDSLLPKKVPYTQLTATEKYHLCTAIVLDAFVRLNSAYGRTLLDGVLRPYELDPLEAVLKLDKGVLMISTTKTVKGQEVTAGFGANVKERDSPQTSNEK